MGDHDQQPPLESVQIEGEYTDYHEPHVCYGGVRHQLFRVGLNGRHPRRVDDTDNTQGEHECYDPRILSRIREKRQQESHEPVGPHLEQDRRQHHGPRGRRLYVRVRQPGMEREDGDLDCERQREGPKQPHLLTRCQRNLEQVHEGEGRDTEQCLAPGIHVQNPHQHQEGSDRGVEEELYRCIDSTLSSPYSDDEIHRNQRQLEEHVEQKQIHGREHSNDPDLEKKHERVERLLSLLDVVERPQDGERGREGAQHDHEQADPVQAECVIHTPRFDPR